MKIKELINLLQKCPNQDAQIWVHTTSKHWEIESIGRRWIFSKDKPYENGDEDFTIWLQGMPFD